MLDAYCSDLFATVPMRRIETPVARHTDPETSRLAAEHVTKTGARSDQQNKAAEAVRQFPDCTSFELAMRTGIDRYTLARRLPECETAGRVRKGPIRTCTVTGRKAHEWGVV